MINQEINTFRQFCETAQAIMEARGTNAKTALFSNYLKSLPTDQDIFLAAQFIGEGAFSTVSGKRASVGYRTVATLAAEFCEIDYELVFKPCRTATGSSSETIEKLFENLPAVQNKVQPANLSLTDIKDITEKLYETRTRELKQEVIIKTWLQMTPIEVKYFIRILGQGSLRIGFETKSVVSTIAKAFEQTLEEVRYAHMITGSLGKTALLAKTNTLHEASFNIFHPISFMLASPVESRSIQNFSDYIAEEKFDGMRCQAHIDKGEVKLFSRDLNDITSSFPEIISFFKDRDPETLVLDGEVCVFKDNTILPFQLLQKRMGVKKPSKALLDEYPVLFISYDVLYADTTPIFDHTLEERRKLLEQLSQKYHLPVTSQIELKNENHIEELFARAIAHGNEGLMLKKKDSTYEYGQRKKSWLKVKHPGGSIDTVILYAHAGSGKRGGTYSDFTLGISVKDDERYEEEFIPIGKAYGGYSNEELKELNKRIKKITLERFGPTVLLKPEIVVELEFDEIQVNKRTKAKYTLRLPRFKAIRWDLSPGDSDTLKEVERMFEENINKKRLTQDKNPSFYFTSDS